MAGTLKETKEQFEKEEQDSGGAGGTLSRDQVIIRTSVIGILANVLLAAFKALAGLATHSIAITMDGVNNLSDAASSVITIAGTKLAGKEPDRKHPFGYGRIEYLTAMVIAVLVLYAGITALKESIGKIIHPVAPEYAPVPLVIIAVAVLVKILLGRFVTSRGKRVNSDSLKNSGADATLDSVISAAVLAAALIYLWTGLSLEAWLGAAIAALIIKSGIDMLRETLSKILGERADAEMAARIKEIVCSFPEVQGAYDLVLNNYGPDTYNGSIHIEVPDTCSVDRLDELLREIAVKVYHECHVILTAIGVYSLNTRDPRAREVREEVRKIVMSHEHIRQMHGFHLNEEKKTIRFDLVVGFEAEDRRALYRHVIADVQERYPEYTLQVAMDTDFSES